MAAPKGNKFYRLRNTSGPKFIYETAEEFIEKCNEYFDYIDNNPLMEEVIVNKPWTEWVEDPIEEGQEAPKMRKITHAYSRQQQPKKRPYTQKGLCLFLEISEETFREYGKTRKDLIEVVTRVRTIIENQKYEGATAGFFNANIIARDLGLIDRKDHTSKGSKIGKSIGVKIIRNK